MIYEDPNPTLNLVNGNENKDNNNENAIEGIKTF
jgi:hypothetical protein